MNFKGRTITWTALRAARAPLLLALLSLTAGCTTSGSGPVATTSSFGPTVAFESVDGPPPQVFERLVRALETESASRSFTIVSREVTASYRIRSYLSAQVRRGKTTIAWVWDVYDRDQQRALRLSGEEPGGKGGRDAWAIADDQVMRRIAQAGLSGVSNLISGAGPAQDTPAPETPRTGPAIAQIDPNRPESGSVQTIALAFSAH
ncbi:MAG: hypothetical protein V4661_10430 [Pseudomonadota bacterium]